MWENVWWAAGGAGGWISGTQVAGCWWDLRATPWDTLVERCPASNPGVGSGSGPGPISADKSILLALESKLCLAGR